VRSIIEMCVRFRLLVIALAAGIMVVGVIQLPRMSVDVLPETSPVVVDVQTEALGLSAAEVEALVTVPLEKNLLEGVMGVTDVTSDSVPGLSAIQLHFAPGTNLYQARQLVQERLTQAFVLPNVSKPPAMLEPVSTTSNVMLIGLSSKSLSLIDLSVLARWTIVPRLLGLAGVANVSTFGQADMQLQVMVDPAKLAAKNVTLAQVIETAGNAQLVSPLSYLEASTPGAGGYLEGPNQRLTIRPVLPFSTPANLDQLPISGAPANVLLGSVAQVVEGHQPLIGDAQVRGNPSLVLVVQKLPSANVLAITREVDQALAGLKPGLPGVSIDASLFRQANYVQSAVSNVRLALIIAALLAALALIALLLQLRLAFTALVAMTLSLVSATLLIDLLGYTFNALVLLGLLLAIGIVTADAVGDTHRIMTRLGEPPGPDAAPDSTTTAANGQSGTREPVATLVPAICAEFRGALAAATVAVLLSVVPLYLASGLTAAFLRPMVVAYGLAIAVSMVVAITVTPALTVLLLSTGQRASRGARLWRRIEAGYLRSLDWVARVPRVALAAVCVAVGLAGLAGLPWLHPGQPQFQDRNLVINWSGASGMSLTEMNRITALASSELQAIPGVQDVGATLGRAVTSDQIVNTNSGEIWVTMKPDANYGQTFAAVQAIAEGTPGMNGVVSTYESDSMGGVLTAPPNQVVTRVYGSSYPELEQLAGRVQTMMDGIPGVHGTGVMVPVDQPTVDVEVNLDNAQRNGLTPGDVRREAGTLLSGLTVGNFFQDQKVFDVVVWGTPGVRGSTSDLDGLLLDTPNGHVKLGNVAQVSISGEPADIQHEAMSRYLDITANVSGRSIGAVSADITNRLQAMSFPLEYHAEVLSSAQLTSEQQTGSQQGGTSRGQFISYVVAALLGILLLIQAALGSWRLALLAFASLPVSLAGGVLITYATGGAGTLGAAAGLLAVFGIAVRQAIAVTARMRGLQAAGDGDRVQMVRRAAADGAGQLAAVTVVTVVVLLPFIVMGDRAGTEILHTAAAVICGGLVTTALVGLFALPAIFLRLGPAENAPDEEPAGEPDWAPPPTGVRA
jgi:Cu/Ag efflux pump CusA